MTIAATYQRLRDGIQHCVYRVIDWPISILVSAGITPNMITTLGLLGNIAAATLMVMAGQYIEHSHTLVALGGLTILLAGLMDMVDGRMARTAGLCSTFGAFYDSVLDRYCELFTLSGIIFCFFAWGQPWCALITLLSLIGSIMVSYVRARSEGLGIECKVGLMQRPERVVLTALGALLYGLVPASTGIDPLYWLIGSQAIIAVLSNTTAIQRLYHVYDNTRGQAE